MTSLLGTAASKQSARATGTQPVARRASRAISTGDAQTLLADLGFLLVPGAPLDRGPAYLLVALRPRPTRAHFDPERITFWSRSAGGDTPAELEWPMEAVASRYSWGTIRIVDRVRAENRFASFGGSVNVSRDLGVHAALFRSEAPIVSSGGHSGPADPFGLEVAAFFARLRGAAGYDSPVKALADRFDPLSIYASFLTSTVAMFERPSSAVVKSARLISLLRAERWRLERDEPRASAEGSELALELMRFERGGLETDWRQRDG